MGTGGSFTTARHFPLSWATWIQSTPSHPISLWSVLLLSLHLHLGFPPFRLFFLLPYLSLYFSFSLSILVYMLPFPYDFMFFVSFLLLPRSPPRIYLFSVLPHCILFVPDVYFLLFLLSYVIILLSVPLLFVFLLLFILLVFLVLLHAVSLRIWPITPLCQCYAICDIKRFRMCIVSVLIFGQRNIRAEGWERVCVIAIPTDDWLTQQDKYPPLATWHTQ